MKRIITFLAFLSFTFVTANAQSVLDKVLDALVGDTKKEDRNHKTIDAGGEAALTVPKHLLEEYNITYSTWDYDNNKVRIITSNKNGATIQGLRSTSSTVVNYKYYYKTRNRDGKEVSESATYPFTITINRIEPTSISIDQERTVGWGCTASVIPTLRPDYSEADMQFDTDNPQSVTVNSNGVAYGEALGDAIVTIRTDNGLTTSTHVTCVIPEVSEVNIEGYNKKEKIYEGDELNLNYNVKPIHAQPKVTWCSSDDSIATVDQQGHVKIIGHGTVHIYCTNDANGVKGDLKLKPKKAK